MGGANPGGAAPGGGRGGAPSTGGIDAAPSGGKAAGGTSASASTSGGANSGGAAGGRAATGGVASGGIPSGGAAISGGAPAFTGGSSGAPPAAGASGSGDTDGCDVAVYEENAPPRALTLSGNLGTHDPVVIAAHGRFYLFSTGDNLGSKTSDDLRVWQAAPEVFTSATRPAWIATEVPLATNLWAPDISYFGGSFHLYYSASSFGCNVSCIGHATRAALDSGTWTDHGSVVCSNPGRNCQSGTRPDDWNAIDPNVFVDRDGTPWLAFGSFWGGLKLIELDASGARKNDELHSIAARPDASGALEAPFIIRRCGYYYLFVSWDSCCKGVDSTYNVRVGRARAVTGPYVDRDGTELMQGGGTLVVQGAGRFHGPGHNAILFHEEAAYDVHHAYDAESNGDPVLRISELAWDDQGWPISGGP